MKNKERRFLQSDAAVAVEDKKITGYAAVFGKRSQDLGDFVEIIDAHAFDACLAASPDIKGLINHDEALVLGRTKSGTMRVSVDAVGLKYEIDPPATSYADDLMVSMARKDIDASSFGFFCTKDAWTFDKSTRQNVRTVLEASVFDCSIVTNPAYLEASAQVRSLFPEDKGELPEAIRANIAELRNAQRKEKRGRSLLSAVSSSKWAILPEKLETICAFLTNWSDGHVASKEEVQAAMMGFDQEYESQTYADSVEEQSPVAVISMYGTIGQKMNMMTAFSGGCSCESLTKDFRAALADDAVTAIVFDVDSPGGTVTGVPELAAEILTARGKKPIIAVANGMAASAAFWLASAADKLVVIPSGEVGSIGVYTTHQDVSAAMEKAGVKMTFIQAGKFKTDGNPYEPVTESYLADAQKGVDEFYEMFIAGVAAGRGVSADKVKADFGQGRMLMAKDALAAGMVDSIQTLDEVVAGLVASSGITASAQSAISDPNVIDVIYLSIAAVVAPVLAEAVVAVVSDPTLCKCLCSSCADGDCSGCVDEDCDWEDDDDSGCDCGWDGDSEDGDEIVGTDIQGSPVVASAVTGEVRAASKTKSVDGEDLEKSAFAYQGSDSLEDWHLPIEFSTDEKSKSRVRDAISRWDQTDMPNAAEKNRARDRIKAAAKKYDIDLAAGDLALSQQEAVELEANLNMLAFVQAHSI